MKMIIMMIKVNIKKLIMIIQKKIKIPIIVVIISTGTKKCKLTYAKLYARQPFFNLL